MSRRAATFLASDVTRAIRGAEAVGRRVSKIEFDPTGKIVLTYETESAAPETSGVDLVSIMQGANGQKARGSRAD